MELLHTETALSIAINRMVKSSSPVGLHGTSQAIVRGFFVPQAFSGPVQDRSVEILSSGTYVSHFLVCTKTMAPSLRRPPQRAKRPALWKRLVFSYWTLAATVVLVAMFAGRSMMSRREKGEKVRTLQHSCDMKIFGSKISSLCEICWIPPIYIL